MHLVLFATMVLIATIACISSAADANIPDNLAPLLGCWQYESDSGDPRVLICFEPARVLFYENNRLCCARARYGSGKVTAIVWGHDEEFNVAVDKALLTITYPDGRKRTYKGLDKKPAEFEINPLKLGAEKISAEQIEEIKAELTKRRETDQGVRTGKIAKEKMLEIDQDNTAYVTRIVSKYGWIDVERFGDMAAQTAFLIVQHSGKIPLMLAALPEIEKDVRAKRLHGDPYVLLYDRLQLNLGYRQRYGSQLSSDGNGNSSVPSLENRAKVDQLRKEMGMMPLNEYLKHFGDPSKITFPDAGDEEK